MKCLKCNADIISAQCDLCNTNQEEFIFNNLETLTLDELLAFIFQSNLFERDSNSIKAVLNDLLIYKKKEKNILELLLNGDLLNKVLNTSSLEQAERLVVIETKKLVDTFEINEELVYNITRSFVQAIKPQYTIRDYIKKNQVPKTKGETFKKPKFRFLIVIVSLMITAIASITIASIIGIFNNDKLISKDTMVSVTFMLDNGTIIEEYNAEVGSDVDVPLVGIRKDHDFSGWYNGDSMLPAEVKSIIVPNYDITYTAVYVTSDTTSFSIIYQYSDGRIIQAYNAEEGKSVDIPTPEHREGYTFIGWQGKTFSRKGADTLAVPPFDEVFTAVYEPLNYVSPSLDEISNKITSLKSGSINIVGSNNFINEVSNYLTPGDTCTSSCNSRLYEEHIILQISETITEDELFALDHFLSSDLVRNLEQNKFIGLENNGRYIFAIRGTEEYAISVIKGVFENDSSNNTLVLAEIYDKLSTSKEGSFNIVGSNGFINEVSQYIVPGLTCTESCSSETYSGHLLIQLSDNLTEEEQNALEYIIQSSAIKSIKNEQYVLVEDGGRYIVAIRGSEEYTIDIIKEVFNQK